ncbi:MAG TPA: FtsQ-type POTRA domain-containing protein [Pyrinomonadaceae bacterium]|nr:FtsQ-type POTRA domain-containing protein [Pyrinomonadaceae bacterium]
MKEQVVAPRGVRRAASQQKGFVQKPARRDGSARREFNFSPRVLFTYVPKALKIVLAVLIVIIAIVGYRVAASAAMFEVKTIDVTGTSRTSPEEIQTLTRRALSKTGVWRANLTALSNELSRLPGVRSAVVTRVLPDGLRVRITERSPVAVVRTAAGHFVWVDDEGVMLGEMKPDDQTPPFFIRGWDEDGSEDARKENAARVQKYLELSHSWSAENLSERVSEVTLIDLRDIRVQLAGNDSQIEVRLGSQDAASHLKIALDELDRYKQGGRGSSISYVAVLAGRVVIGSSSGSKPASADANSAALNSAPAAEGDQTKLTAEGNQNRTATNPNKPSSTERQAVTGEANQKKRERKDGPMKDRQAGPAPRVP